MKYIVLLFNLIFLGLSLYAYYLFWFVSNEENTLIAAYLATLVSIIMHVKFNSLCKGEKF